MKNLYLGMQFTEKSQKDHIRIIKAVKSRNVGLQTGFYSRI